MQKDDFNIDDDFYLDELLTPNIISQVQDSKYSSSNQLHSLIIPPSAISPNGTEWLHCVEVTKTKQLIKLRVITKYNQGVNIQIPMYVYNPEVKEKYKELRYKVRNYDHVEITVPCMQVRCSAGWSSQVYLLTDNFTIRETVQ